MKKYIMLGLLGLFCTHSNATAPTKACVYKAGQKSYINCVINTNTFLFAAKVAKSNKKLIIKTLDIMGDKIHIAHSGEWTTDLSKMNFSGTLINSLGFNPNYGIMNLIGANFSNITTKTNAFYINHGTYNLQGANFINAIFASSTFNASGGKINLQDAKFFNSKITSRSVSANGGTIDLSGADFTGAIIETGAFFANHKSGKIDVNLKDANFTGATVQAGAFQAYNGSTINLKGATFSIQYPDMFFTSAKGTITTPEGKLIGG